MLRNFRNISKATPMHHFRHQQRQATGRSVDDLLAAEAVADQRQRGHDADHASPSSDDVAARISEVLKASTID